MKITSRYITSLIVSLLLTQTFASCIKWNEQLNERLALAENLMKSDPDAAYNYIVDSVKPNYDGRLISKEQEAEFGRVYTKVCLLSGEALPEDSIISRSVELYASFDNSGKLAESLYLQGLCRSSRGEYSEAVSSLIKALLTTEESNDRDLSLKIRDALEKIYEPTGLPHSLADITSRLADGNTTLDENVAVLTLDSIRDSALLRESVLAGERIYSLQNALDEAMTSISSRALWISLTILICFIISVALMIIRKRMSNNDAEMNRQMTEIMLLTRRLETTSMEKVSISATLSRRESAIEHLSEDLSAQTDTNRQLNEMMDNLLHGRFSHLNTIINEYTDQTETEDNYLAFYKNIKYEIERLKQPKGLKEIDKIVNFCKKDILVRIREQFPKMREKDLTLLSLSLAGLNARAIGLFTDMHANSTYKRKKQLIKMIADSDAPDKEWFITELNAC